MEVSLLERDKRYVSRVLVICSFYLYKNELRFIDRFIVVMQCIAINYAGSQMISLDYCVRFSCGGGQNML